MKNKIKNSETYLNSVLSNKKAFTTPKNYFDDVENEFFTTLTEIDIPEKKGFSTPENYFDDLEGIILDEIKTVEKRPKIISIKQKTFQLISIAAAACIILFFTFYYNNNQETEINFDTIAQNDIENWILENATEIATEDITNENIDLNDFANNGFRDNAIEDYIIFNESTIILNETY